MSIWLDKPRRHPDGRHKMSGQKTMRSASQNFTEILSCFEPRPDSVALSTVRSHFSCMQFPYQGFTGPDQGNGRSDGWSDARNFHISSSRVRTMKADVWTSKFSMRDLPYGAGRTLSVVRTDASWNSSKLLDTEEGPDGWCFGQLGIWMVYHIVRMDVTWLMTILTE